MKRTGTLLAALALAISAALALVGVGLLPLVAASVGVWLVLLSVRWGAALGVASSLLGGALLTLACVVTFPVLGITLLGGSIDVWALVGVGGLAVFVRTKPTLDMARWRAAAWMWIPPLLGTGIWTAVMLASVLVGGASHYSWVMMGDSANNILFARETVYANGIHLGPDANPVPLPAAFIALAMSAGRAVVAPADLLQHDIGSFALIWALLIALSCYLAGVAAAIVIDRRRRWVVAAVGAGASLIPLSWFVTGYPIEYGFFNTHLALPIVFLSWIAAMSAERRPVVAFAGLLVGSTLMLAVWSPLVLIPLLLALVVLVRQWRSILAARGIYLVLLLAALVQLVAYGLVATLPSVLAQGGFLTGLGGIIPFPRTVIIVAGVGTLVVAGLALWRKATTAGLNLAAVLVAGGIGIGTLLFLNRNQPSLWTYYPTKLAWLMTIVFGVLALGVLVGLLPPVRKAVFGMLAVVLAVLTMGALYAVAKSIPSYSWRDPIPRILADDFGAGDAVAEKIFDLSDPAHPSILWQSGDPTEGTINFWLLQMRADSTSANRELRVFAYAHGDTVDDLCTIAAAMGAPVVAHTANGDLDREVASSCPGAVIVKLEGS